MNPHGAIPETFQSDGKVVIDDIIIGHASSEAPQAPSPPSSETSIRPSPSRDPIATFRRAAERMAATMSDFPLFSLFPAELRKIVWHDALPADLGRCVFPYRKGCWQPRTISDEERAGNGQFSYHQGYTPDLIFEFRTERLGTIRFELPVAFVSHEAQCVALSWLRRNGMRLQPHPGHECLLATRSFNTLRDVLFVAPDRWRDFVMEQTNRHSQPDLRGQEALVLDVPIRHFAVMEETVRKDGGDWLSMHNDCDEMRKLYIIRGDAEGEGYRADWRNWSDYSFLTQRWCEIGPAPTKEYSWDADDALLKCCNPSDEGREEFSAFSEELLAELRSWLETMLATAWAYGEGEFDLYSASVVVRS